MGNTSSSSRPKRNISIISKPRVLTSPQAPPPLGPAVVVSPSSETTYDSHNSTRSSASASSVSRRATFDGSRARLNLTEAVDVRRSRTANASPGPSREDRASQLGAPPPYSAAIASPFPHNHSSSEDREDGAPAPSTGLQSPRSQHGHRRTQSEASPGAAHVPSTHTATGGEEYVQRPLPPIPASDVKVPPEELGYGAGRYI